MTLDPKAAHRECCCNHDLLHAAESCGCFHCLAVFPPTLIDEWIDEKLADGRAGRTALCPRCGIDSVIPIDAPAGRDASFLRQMKAMWFEQSIALDEMMRLFESENSKRSSGPNA
ncbi:MAG: hypothetical protein ACKVS9_05670 [Phycisphaerae bacterium]